MKINLSFLLLLSCWFILCTVNGERNFKHDPSLSNSTKDAVDTKAATRQDISYNLDFIKQNGSSTVMYSQANDVINGGFTDWSAWSECNNACDKRTLRSRERYCTNPSPSNGGADCDGERFQLGMCKVTPCSPVVTHRPKPRHAISKFGQWSGWSRCECDKGYQKRYRQCYSHNGVPCFGHRVQEKACKPTGCEKTDVGEKSSLVDIDPKQFCGFNPCDISKCLLAPLGSCVSDYKCRPAFFDENNKRVEGCSGNHIYVSPSQVPRLCKINPCKFTRCLMDFTEERCVVGTKCQAVYYSAEGKPQKCTPVLKVPAREVCGYDPCDGESCQDNPNARCLVTSKCTPVYVNAFNERIRKCEEEAASKNNRIQEGREEEFEAEPDEDDYNDEEENEIDDEDTDNDDNDDEFDDNRYAYLKHFYGHERNRYVEDDGEDNEGDNERSETTQGREDDNEDNEEDDVDSELNDFKAKLAKAEGSPKQNPKKAESQVKPNENMAKNSKGFSNPLLKLLNVENGERRSKKAKEKVEIPTSINPSSFNLEDLVRGKLNNSSGLIVGTVKKSMKILSNKKPTTYYYFETKGKNPKENRQFMVITAPKTKKSSVHPSQRNMKDRS